MSTIGEQQTERERWLHDREEQRRVEKRKARRETVATIGIVIGLISIVLFTMFALVYLVVLAVRLAWGS